MKILNVIKNIIIIFLLISFVFVLVMTLFHFKAYSVVTDSMAPEIKRGYAVFTRQVDFNDLQVGDIVTVQMKSGNTFTHRIVEIDRDNGTFCTKGENSKITDGQSKKENILGKVIFSLPLVGYISIFVSDKINLAIMCSVLLVLLLISKIAVTIINKKKGVAENEKS